MSRVLIFGAGRMAGSLISVADEFPDLSLVAQVSRTPPTSSGKGPGFFPSLDVARTELDGGIDLVIDFSLPEGTLTAARWCAERQVALLSGVSALGDEAYAALDNVARSAPVLWAANLSIGINLMSSLLQRLGRLIAPDAGITIEDIHHVDKRDAPSGTALFLARQIRPPADGGGGTDPRRIAADFPSINFRSRREGDVVGEHTVTVSLRDESLTLAHHAEDRRLFARGALDAAQWLIKQPPGRYSAGDWISSKMRGPFSGASSCSTT